MNIKILDRHRPEDVARHIPPSEPTLSTTLLALMKRVFVVMSKCSNKWDGIIMMSPNVTGQLCIVYCNIPTMTNTQQLQSPGGCPSGDQAGVFVLHRGCLGPEGLPGACFTCQSCLWSPSLLRGRAHRNVCPVCFGVGVQEPLSDLSNFNSSLSGL